MKVKEIKALLANANDEADLLFCDNDGKVYRISSIEANTGNMIAPIETCEKIVLFEDVLL